MAFEIGDRVFCQFADRNDGLYGIVVDRLLSGKDRKIKYCVQFDGTDQPNGRLWDESELEEVPDESYEMRLELHENVVVALLVKTVGDVEKIVARGHGHVLHDGIYGFAQACSYATKRVWNALQEGE